MPNWCFNHLYVTGNKESVDKFRDDVRASKEEDKDPFILETFLPLPEGTEDWYTWCTTNWGTKWGDCDTREGSVDDGLLYIFNTAWSPPVAGIEKISSLFPDLHFVLVYEEGGMQYMGGDYIHNGVIEMTVDVDYPDMPDYDDFDDSITEHMDLVNTKFSELVDALQAACASAQG